MMQNHKTAITVAASVVASSAAIYAAYKLLQPTPIEIIKDKAVQLVFTAPAKGAGDFGNESFATIEDFARTKEVPIDFDLLLKEKMSVLTPYSADDFGRIILVETDPHLLFDEESATETFMYQTQRTHATKAYAVPIDIFVSTLEKLMQNEGTQVQTDLNQTAFLYSTGRCGSTFLSKLLGCIDGVKSLHEPDIYSVVAAYLVLKPEIYTKESARKLLRLSTWMLIKAAKSAFPTTKYVQIKFRSQVVIAAELLKEAVPECKTVFLYRDALDTIDSFCLAFFNTGINKLVRTLRVDSFLYFHVIKLPLAFICPLISDSRFDRNKIEKLGAVGITIMSWISCIDQALQLSKNNFFDAMIRYEDLKAGALSSLLSIIDAIGFRTDSLDVKALAEKVHKTSSQQAHGEKCSTSSIKFKSKVKGHLYLRTEDLASVKDLIACHEEIQVSSFVIPGTIGVNTDRIHAL